MALFGLRPNLNNQLAHQSHPVDLTWRQDFDCLARNLGALLQDMCTFLTQRFIDFIVKRHSLVVALIKLTMVKNALPLMSL